MTWNITSDSAPPMVDVYVDGLPAGTVAVELWRVWTDGGFRVRVRGDRQARITSDSVRVLDYDAPVGMEIAYRVIPLDVDGADVGTVADSAPLTVTAQTDLSYAWISNPFSPSGSLLLKCFSPTDSQRSYETDARYAQQGSDPDMLVAYGKRRSASDWPWVFRTVGREQWSEMHSLIGDGGPLLIRPHPDCVWHDTGLIWLHSPTVTAPRHPRTATGIVDWMITGITVMPPKMAAVDHTWDYAAMTAAYVGLTYADLRDLYTGETYLDLARATHV